MMTRLQVEYLRSCTLTPSYCCRLRAEVAMNALGIFFAGLEFVIGFFVFISFFVANRRY